MDTQHQGFLLETGHIGTFCIAYTENPRLPGKKKKNNSNKNSRCSTQTILFAQFRYHKQLKVGRAHPKSTFPDIMQGLSRGGSCSPAILTPSCPASLHNPTSVGSVAQSCPACCDPMDCSTPGFPVHHQLPKLTQFMCIE